MAKEILECEVKQCGLEITKCQSGEWFAFSQHDLEVFIADTKTIIGKYISADDKIALFLDLDNAYFLSLILYSACIDCGSTVIRCGISDLDRQFPLQSEIDVDWIISTDIVYRHIKDKIRHKKRILVYSVINVESKLISTDEIRVFELYNVPVFIIKTESNMIIPGYNIESEENHMVIKKKTNIEDVNLPDIVKDNLLHIDNPKMTYNESVIEFVSLNVNELLKEYFSNEVFDGDSSMIMNSIGLIELLVKIEEEFGIIFPIERVSSDIFKSSKLLSEIIFSIILEK